MTERWNSLRVAQLLTSTALMACAQVEPVPDGFLGTAEQAIIGGAPAEGEKYAAVGALVFVVPEFGVIDVFCSGTLVAPAALVTARHCTPLIDLGIAEGLNPSFAIGPDALSPTAIIPITSYVAAPPGDEGLLLDGGRDVAVAYLASEASGVTPAELGRFENSMLGNRFEIAGYGVYDVSGIYGQRYAGRATARAIKGRWYKLLFGGDYDAFLEWYFTDSSAALPSAEEAKEWWKIYELEKNFELLAGGLPGEAVGCFGDSGGPLLRRQRGGQLAIYGVSFAVEGTFSTACGLGGGYLVFNRKMLDFVSDAL
jgi:hypothetical protein